MGRPHLLLPLLPLIPLLPHAPQVWSWPSLWPSTSRTSERRSWRANRAILWVSKAYIPVASGHACVRSFLPASSSSKSAIHFFNNIIRCAISPCSFFSVILPHTCPLLQLSPPFSFSSSFTPSPLCRILHRSSGRLHVSSPALRRRRFILPYPHQYYCKRRDGRGRATCRLRRLPR